LTGGLMVLAVSATLSGVIVPSATAAAATQPLPVGSLGGANLVFSDEFTGTALDANRWRTCSWWAATTCSIEPNSELELYTPNNVSVANGMLKLQARQETAVGWNSKIYNYTSGMVSTGGLGSQVRPGFTYTYGYAETRVRVPTGRGLWPAFWMLPADHSWPPEIDAMEIQGQEPNVTHMTYHYLDASGNHQGPGSAWSGPDFSAGWHTFGVDWQPNAVVWYVDGVERSRFTDASAITNKASYLLLNLAVGGSWLGSPDASTRFPSNYLVDYVRVWDKFGTPAPLTTKRLLSVRSGKAAQPGWGSTADGTQMVQEPTQVGSDQQWALSSLGGGIYTITSAKSGKLLDVANGSVADGAAVVEWPANGSTSQQWRLVSVGTNIYHIVSVKSGKLLDVSGGSTTDGAPILQWPDNGATNQQWQIS